MQELPGFIHIRGLQGIPEGPVKLLLSVHSYWQALYVRRSTAGEYYYFFSSALEETPEGAWNADIDEEDRICEFAPLHGGSFILMRWGGTIT